MSNDGGNGVPMSDNGYSDCLFRTDASERPTRGEDAASSSWCPNPRCGVSGIWRRADTGRCGRCGMRWAVAGDGASAGGVDRAVPTSNEPLVGGGVAAEAPRPLARRKHVRRLIAAAPAGVLLLCARCRVEGSVDAIQGPDAAVDQACEVCGQRPALLSAVDLDADRRGVIATIQATANLVSVAVTANRIAVQLGLSYLDDQAGVDEREGFVALLVDELAAFESTMDDAFTVVGLELGVPIGEAGAVDGDAPAVPVCGRCIDRIDAVSGARLPWDEREGSEAPCSLCGCSTAYVVLSGGAR